MDRHQSLVMAKKLGLKDMGSAASGQKICQDCGGKLRFGEYEDRKTVSYCPGCVKIIEFMAMPRD